MAAVFARARAPAWRARRRRRRYASAAANAARAARRRPLGVGFFSPGGEAEPASFAASSSIDGRRARQHARPCRPAASWPPRRPARWPSMCVGVGADFGLTSLGGGSTRRVAPALAAAVRRSASRGSATARRAKEHASHGWISSGMPMTTSRHWYALELSGRASAPAPPSRRAARRVRARARARAAVSRESPRASASAHAAAPPSEHERYRVAAAIAGSIDRGRVVPGAPVFSARRGTDEASYAAPPQPPRRRDRLRHRHAPPRRRPAAAAHEGELHAPPTSRPRAASRAGR